MLMKLAPAQKAVEVGEEDEVLEDEVLVDEGEAEEDQVAAVSTINRYSAFGAKYPFTFSSKI